MLPASLYIWKAHSRRSSLKCPSVLRSRAVFDNGWAVEMEPTPSEINAANSWLYVCRISFCYFCGRANVCGGPGITVRLGMGICNSSLS